MSDVDDSRSLPETGTINDAGDPAGCYVLDLVDRWHISTDFDGYRHTTACCVTLETSDQVVEATVHVGDVSGFVCEHCLEAFDEPAEEIRTDGGRVLETEPCSNCEDRPANGIDGLCSSCRRRSSPIADGGEIDETDVFERADELWGVDLQLDVAVEELAELITEIQHWRRSRVGIDEIADELADVDLVVEQLKRYVGIENFREQRQRKLERLERRIEQGDDL